MAAETQQEESLLRKLTDTEYPTLTRSNATYTPTDLFSLTKGNDRAGYNQQYGDMYFLRLAKLKPAVERIAKEAWDGYQLAGENANHKDRVLDVRQGELCWVAGTIYMDMPLKPNILEDIAKDHWIAAPPPREVYTSPDGKDQVMLEDESGRLRLIGAGLQNEMLVTGCIVAVLGTENAAGDFEVIEMRIPGLPSQSPRALSSTASDPAKRTKVAIVSGLEITGEAGDSLALDLFMEWLLGESTSPTLQAAAAQVSRLIIAGNSTADSNPLSTHEERVTQPGSKKAAAQKKYGYDSSAYNPAPTAYLDQFLATLLPSLPITLLPGASDPANVSLPQQPLHPALFPRSKAYASPPAQSTGPPPKQPKQGVQTSSQPYDFPLHPATNPVTFSIDSTSFLGTSGQPTLDIAKYLTPASVSELPDASYPAQLLEATLKWRLIAPTAPDTLWCYPYQINDPFVLGDKSCPHVYFAGCQDVFETAVLEGEEGQSVRVVGVPRFSERGEVVLLDLETLDVELLKFQVWDEKG